jgi:hypothetical protein
VSTVMLHGFHFLEPKHQVRPERTALSRKLMVTDIRSHWACPRNKDLLRFLPWALCDVGVSSHRCWLQDLTSQRRRRRKKRRSPQGLWAAPYRCQPKCPGPSCCTLTSYCAPWSLFCLGQFGTYCCCPRQDIWAWLGVPNI